MRTGEKHRVIGAAAVLLTAMLCASCAPESTTAPSTRPSTSASASSAPSEAAATLLPEGSAQENLPYFAQVIEAVWAGDQRTQGRAYVDALVAAGFDKMAMQVTADETSIGNAVDALSVSVKWSDQCLIGQAGPETGEAVAVAMPFLADGGCLIGATRPIDW